MPDKFEQYLKERIASLDRAEHGHRTMTDMHNAEAADAMHSRQELEAALAIYLKERDDAGK